MFCGVNAVRKNSLISNFVASFLGTIGGMNYEVYEVSNSNLDLSCSDCYYSLFEL